MAVGASVHPAFARRNKSSVTPKWLLMRSGHASIFNTPGRVHRRPNTVVASVSGRGWVLIQPLGDWAFHSQRWGSLREQRLDHTAGGEKGMSREPKRATYGLSGVKGESENPFLTLCF